AEAQGLGREVALLYNNLAEALWSIDGPRAWLDTLREGAAYAARRGIEEFVLSLTTGTVEALVDLGSHEESMALAVELVPRLEGVEDVFDLIVARSSQARVLTRRGEHAKGGPLAEWATERARELADSQAIAQALPT